MPIKRKSPAVRSLAPETETREITETLTTITPTPHVDPEDDGASRAVRYSLLYHRYPGAPGTALALAREALERAEQATRRERARKSAEKAEREHLGINSIGKKRKSSSPFAADSEEDLPRRNAPRARRSSSRQNSPAPLGDHPRGPSPRPRNAPVHPSPRDLSTSRMPSSA